MSQYLTKDLQMVKANHNVLFNEELTCKALSHIKHDQNGTFTVYKTSRPQKRDKYKLTFGANIAIPKEERIQPTALALCVNENAVLSSAIINTPASTDSYYSINRSMILEFNSDETTQFSVRNIGATDLKVRCSVFLIEPIE